MHKNTSHLICLLFGLAVIACSPPAQSQSPSEPLLNLEDLTKHKPQFTADFQKGWQAEHQRGSRAGQNPEAFKWRFSQMQNNQSGQVIQDPQNPENKVMQFLWQNNAKAQYDSNTQKKAHLYGPFGKTPQEEELWSFDLYFPSEGMEKDSEPGILIQWHGKADACETDRRPPIALDNKNNQLTLTWLSDAQPCTPLGFSNWKTGSQSLGPTPKDRWVNLIFHIRFSPEGKGLIRVWKDKRLVIDQRNIYLGFNDAQGAYLGFGIYQFTQKSEHPERKIFFDNIQYWNLKEHAL